MCVNIYAIIKHSSGTNERLETVGFDEIMWTPTALQVVEIGLN